MLLVSFESIAATVFLDCTYTRCSAHHSCKINKPLVIHFQIESGLPQAWRLGDPIARPLRINRGSNGMVNLVDLHNSGEVEITTITADLQSTHSVHPMASLKKPFSEKHGYPVQYYGYCSEKFMFAAK